MIKSKHKTIFTLLLVLSLLLSLALAPSSAFAVTATHIYYDTPVVNLTVGDSFTNNLTVIPPVADTDFSPAVVAQDPMNPAIQLISDTEVLALAPGTATVSITDNNSGITASFVVHVSGIPATAITWDILNANVQLGDTFTNSLTITPPNASTDFTTPVSSDTSVVQIVDQLTIEAVGVGSAAVSITDMESGITATYNVTVFAVPATSISWATPSTTLGVGDTFTNALVIVPANANTDFDPPVSSDPSVVQIIDEDTIQAVGTGTATVSITDQISGITATYSVTVVPPIPLVDVEYDPPVLFVNANGTYSVDLIFTPSDATDKTGTVTTTGDITSIDEETLSVANIDSYNFGDEIGTMTFTANDGGFTTTVTVIRGIEATDISWEIPNVTLEVGETFTNTLVIVPPDADTNFDITVSSDPTVVQIVDEDTIEAVGVGTATVSITDLNSGITATYTVTVTPAVPVTDVTYIPPILFVDADGTYDVDLIFTPFDATDQTGTVTTTGDVTSIDNDTLLVSNVDTYSFGDVIGTMTFTANDGGVSTTVEVVRGIPITDFLLDRSALTLGIGESDNVIATILPDNATEGIDINVQGPGHVTVTEILPRIYRVTGVTPGLSVVTFTTESGLSRVLLVMVNGSSSTLTLSGLPSIVRVGDTFTLVPSIDDQAGSTGWTWDPSFLSATFDSPATFTALRTGTTTITYTTAGGQSASVTFTIFPRATGTGGGRSPRTGDANGLLIASYSVVGLAAAGTAGYLFLKKRKNKKEN